MTRRTTMLFPAMQDRRGADADTRPAKTPAPIRVEDLPHHPDLAQVAPVPATALVPRTRSGARVRIDGLYTVDDGTQRDATWWGHLRRVQGELDGWTTSKVLTVVDHPEAKPREVPAPPTPLHRVHLDLRAKATQTCLAASILEQLGLEVVQDVVVRKTRAGWWSITGPNLPVFFGFEDDPRTNTIAVPYIEGETSEGPAIARIWHHLHQVGRVQVYTGAKR